MLPVLFLCYDCLDRISTHFTPTTLVIYAQNSLSYHLIGKQT